MAQKKDGQKGRARPQNAAGGAKGGAKQPPPRRQIDIPIYDDKKTSSRVPSADAFDNLKRMPPPNLPGYERDRMAYNAQKAAEQPDGQPPGGQKQPAPRRPAPRRTQKETVNPVQRRRNRRIAAILAVLLLVGLGTWFSVTVWFKIETFTLEGESPYSLEEITAVFGHEPGENMFSFGAASAARRIEQSLPYIETLAVRRRLPGTVVFKAEPAVETYSMAQDGVVAVLSANRKVLRLAEELPAGLVRIDGLYGMQLQPGLPLAPLPGEGGETAPAEAAASKSASEGADPPAEATPEADAPLEGEPPPEGEAIPEGEPVTEGEAIPEGEALPEGEVTPEGETVPEGEAPPEGEPPAEGEAMPEATPEPEPTPAEPLQTPAEALDTLDTLLGALANTGLADITWVNVADPLDLQFCWQDRIVVRLGAKGNLDRKLEFTEILLTDPEKSQITEGDRGTLDVSGYPAVDRVWLTPG